MKSKNGTEKESRAKDFIEIIEFINSREKAKKEYLEKSISVIEEKIKKHNQLEEAKAINYYKESIEIISKIKLKPDRLITNDELKKQVSNMKYLSFNEICNRKINSNCYIIGILCFIRKTPTHLIWEFTNLKKYDSTNFEMSLQNGYKTGAILLYGRCMKMIDEDLGSVYVIMNPLIGNKDDEYEFKVKVKEKTQLIKIGDALNFGYCNFKDDINETPCTKFIDTSIERHCYKHKKAEYSTFKYCNHAGIPSAKDADDSEIDSNSDSINNINVQDKIKNPEEQKEKFNKWKEDETKRFAKFIRNRSHSKICPNKLHTILNTRELIKSDKKNRARTLEITINTEDKKNDDNFIKNIMEKRRKLFSEKFEEEDIVQQCIKRINKSPS